MDEVTHLPDSLQKLLKVTVGMEWPEGSEAGLRAISEAWTAFSRQLEDLDQQLRTSAGQVTDAMDGAAAEAFRERVGHQLPEALGQLREQAEQFAKESKNAAADIQKTKIMVVTMLTVLAATIAELIASLFGSFLIPSVIAAARAGIGAVLRNLVAKVSETGIKDLGKVALTAGRSGDREMAAKGAANVGRAAATLGGDVTKYGAGGAAFMGGLDLGIQGVQDATGARDGIDWDSVEHSAVGGAIGGGAFGVGRSAGRAFSSANRKALRDMPEEQRELLKPGMHVFGTLGYTGMQVGGAVLSTPLINRATGQSTWAMAGAGALGAISRLGRSGSEAGGTGASEAATGADIQDKLVSNGPSDTAGAGAEAGDHGLAGGRGDEGAPVATTSESPRTGSSRAAADPSEGTASPDARSEASGHEHGPPPPAYSFLRDGAPASSGSLHVPEVSGTGPPPPEHQAPFGDAPAEQQRIGGVHGSVGTGFTSADAARGGGPAVERGAGGVGDGPAAETAAPAPRGGSGGANLSSFLGGGGGSALPTTGGDPVEHGATTPDAPAVAVEPAPRGTSEPGSFAGDLHGQFRSHADAESSGQPETGVAHPAEQPASMSPADAGPPADAGAEPPVPPADGAQRGASGVTDADARPPSPTAAPTAAVHPAPPGAASPPAATPRPSAGATSAAAPDVPGGPVASSSPNRADASASAAADRSAGSTSAERPATTSGSSAAPSSTTVRTSAERPSGLARPSANGPHDPHGTRRPAADGRAEYTVDRTGDRTGNEHSERAPAGDRGGTRDAVDGPLPPPGRRTGSDRSAPSEQDRDPGFESDRPRSDREIGSRSAPEGLRTWHDTEPGGRPEPSGRWDHLPDERSPAPRWVWTPSGPVRPPHSPSEGDGPRVVSRANFVDPEHANLYAGQRFPGVPRVNAHEFAENRPGHRTNCANAMVQIANARRFPERAARGEFQAGPSDPVTPRELSDRGVVREYRSASSYGEIESHVLGLPDGAQVPVFLVHQDGSGGHHFLAENRGGAVHYLDNSDEVIAARWPAKHLLYGAFPEGGEVPAVRRGFAQDGPRSESDVPRGADAHDVPGGSEASLVPSGPPEAAHDVSFERGSKELSPQQRHRLDDFVDDLVDRGRAARRRGEPLPDVTVTGRGNGSRMPWAHAGSAQRTAQQRANAVRSAVRQRLAERLDDRALTRSDLRSDDFRITTRAADPDGAHLRTTSEAERTAQVALHPTEPRVIVGDAGHDAETVPRDLHMNWFGDRRPLAGPLGEQIRAWAGKAEQSGWSLHLWVDDRAEAHNADFLAGLPGVQVHNVRDAVPPRGSEAAGIPAGAADAFHYALDRGAFNLSSDVARYAVLHQRGGVYLDVDVAAGEFSLPREPVRLSRSGIPFLAPEIRDGSQASAVRADLAGAEPERWADRAPTDRDVVDWQYRVGNLTNNLIISPPGSPFLRGLLEQVPGVQTLRDQAADLRRNAAHLTGPHRVQRQLEQLLRERGLRGRLVEEFRSGRAAVDPDLVHQWAHRLQWVTDESGDQLHDEHAAPSSSSSSLSSPSESRDAGSQRSQSDPGASVAESGTATPARAAEPADFDVSRFEGPISNSGRADGLLPRRDRDSDAAMPGGPPGRPAVPVDPGGHAEPQPRPDRHARGAEQRSAAEDDAATGAGGQRPEWLQEATRQPWSNLTDVAPFLQLEPVDPHGDAAWARPRHEDDSGFGDVRDPVPEYTPEPRSRVHGGTRWDEVTAESDRLPPYAQSQEWSEPARSGHGGPWDVPGGSRPGPGDGPPDGERGSGRPPLRRRNAMRRPRREDVYDARAWRPVDELDVRTSSNRARGWSQNGPGGSRALNEQPRRLSSDEDDVFHDAPEFPSAGGPGPWSSSTLTDFRSWSQEQPAYTVDHFGPGSGDRSGAGSGIVDVTAFADAPPPSLYDAAARGGSGPAGDPLRRPEAADRRGAFGRAPSGHEQQGDHGHRNAPGARARSNADRSAPLLRGTDLYGRLHEFTPQQVVRTPLFDRRRREIGVTYETEPSGVRQDQRWARSGHHRALRTHPDEIPQEALRRAGPQDWVPAPDHADYSGARPGPIHVAARGSIGGVLVGLLRGERLPDGTVLHETTPVRVDGRTFALINRHCPVLRRIEAAETDPARSLRLGISAFGMDGTAFERVARHFAPVRRFGRAHPETAQRLIARPESDDYVREMARHGFRRPIHAPAGYHERFADGGVSIAHNLPWVSYDPVAGHYVRRIPETADERLPSYDEVCGPPPARAVDVDDPFSLGRAFGQERTNPEDARDPAPPYSESLGEHDARRILDGRVPNASRRREDDPWDVPGGSRPARGGGSARGHGDAAPEHAPGRPARSETEDLPGRGGGVPRTARGGQHPVPEGAVALDSFADGAEADRVFHQHYRAVQGVNADRFWGRARGHVRNCFAALVATSTTLSAGTTVAARSGDRTAVADAERHFGDRFRYSSLEDIAGHMRRQDPGAQGAVFLQRRDGTGHYLLVRTRAQTDQHGPVRDERGEPRRVADFVDGHQGAFADLRGAAAVAFMPIRNTGTTPLPESAVAHRAAERDPGLRDDLGGGHGSSRVAEDHERRILRRYGIPVGSQYGDRSLSPSVLGSLERVLGSLPEGHIRDNPSLRGIVRNRGRGSASAYYADTETIEISHPFGMPGRWYVALDRGSDWQLSTMDQAVIRGDAGADPRRDAELGLRHGDRHVMGGVSRVLAHGNLVEWTLRHEIGHSVDRASSWSGAHSRDPRFGGWRFEGFSASSRRTLARTILQHAGVEDRLQGLADRSGRSTVLDSLAAAVRVDHARSNDVARLPRQFAHHGPQVRDAVERAVRFVRIAASSPWMFNDGRARDLVIGDRIYQIDSMGRWSSYLAAARQHALSNYQFSAREEWFAEAYAAHHDPTGRPRTRLAPAVRHWFDHELPEALAANAEQSGRVRGRGGEPARDAPSAEGSGERAPETAHGDPRDVPGGARPSGHGHRSGNHEQSDRRGQRAGRIGAPSAPRVLRPVQRWAAEEAEEAATGRRRHVEPVSGLLVHGGVVHPDVHFEFDPRRAQGWELFDRDLRDPNRRLVGVCFTDADAYLATQRWALSPQRGWYTWRTAPGEEVPTPLSLSTRANAGLPTRVPAPGVEDFHRHPDGPIEVVTHGSSSTSLTVVNVPAGARLADGRQLRADTNIAVDDRSFLRVLDHSEAFRAAYRSRPGMSLRWFICFMGGRRGTPDVIRRLYREYGYDNPVNVVNTLSGLRGSDAHFGFRHGDMMTTDNGGFSSWRPGPNGEPLRDESVRRATTYSPDEIRAIGRAEGNPDWVDHGRHQEPEQDRGRGAASPRAVSGAEWGSSAGWDSYRGFGAGTSGGGAAHAPGRTGDPRSASGTPRWQYVPVGPDSAQFAHEPSPSYLREMPVVSASSFRGDDTAMQAFMRSDYPQLLGANRGAVGSRDPRWRTNCADATVQGVRAVLSGRRVRPTVPTDPVHYTRMEQSLGSKYAVWPSYDAVTRHMWRQRPGTVGTLLTYYGEAVGHYFLVRRRENDVVFLDAQSERPADLGAVPQLVLFQQVPEGHRPRDLDTSPPWEMSAGTGGSQTPRGAGSPGRGGAVPLDGDRARATAREDAAPLANARQEPPRQPAPTAEAPHDPAALAQRARTEGAKIVGTMDGRQLRAAIDRLADFAGPELRELIKHAFSDQNLTEQLNPRVRDGGYAVDLTPGSGAGPRIAVDLAGLRRRGEHPDGTAEFAGPRGRGTRSSTAASNRANVGSDAFAARIPTPIGVFMAKVLGLVNSGEGGLSVVREHAAATNLTEREVPATTGDYDATYRITVSTPGRHPWSSTTTRTDYVEAGVALAWPRETGTAGGEHRLDFRAHALDAVEGLEFSGLGEVTSAVSRRLGLRQHEERELRAWLEQLGADGRQGKDVFTGGAHETFRFRGRTTTLRVFGRRKNTRVRVFVADGARARALPDVDGEIEHRESTASTSTATRSQTRRRGLGGGMLFGDFTGTTAVAAGLIDEERGSTRNASEVTDEHARETVETYTGRLARRRGEVTFLVQLGDAQREVQPRPLVRFDPVKRAHVLTRVRRYESADLIRVDGGVTMWMKPHRADALGWSDAASGSARGPDAARAEGPQQPGPGRSGSAAGNAAAVARTDPARDAPGASRHDVPDRNDAHFRIPRWTAETWTGAVLHELAVQGRVPARELPTLKKRFLEFLQEQENAAEIINGGDGAVFELSALVPKAPDVFVRADLDRSNAEYLGVPEGTRFTGRTRSAHENAVDITKAREGSRGISAYSVVGQEYPVGRATYETSTEHTQRVGQQIGHEEPFGGERPHSYRYPMQLHARIGGNWVRDSGPDVTVLAPTSGHVEVTASELPGVDAAARNHPAGAEHGDLAPDGSSTGPERGAGERAEARSSGRREASGWYDGEPPADEGAFTLPSGAEPASLKPIPHRVRTAADMLGGDRPGGWRRWAGWPLKLLVGGEPPRFHERRGSPLSRSRNGGPEERNPAQLGLVDAGSRAARQAGFGLAESHRDSRTLLSHNHGGLLGSRDASGRVELATRTSNPRVVSGPVEHTFTRTVHARTGQGTGVRKTRGGEVGGSTMHFEHFSNWLFLGTRPVIDLAAQASRTRGKTTDDASRTTTTARHTERSYLLRADETHVMRTSRRHNWQDSFSAHHGGKPRTAAKWIRVPDNEVWVPASELPAVPGLAEADLAHLHPEDAARYRETHRVQEHRHGPEEGGPARGASQEEPAAAERRPDSALRPPDNVGRGSGRVELHRTAAVRDLVREIEQRLDRWSRENGRVGRGRKVLALAHQAVGKPPVDRPARVAKFDAINERLVHDVLGPAAAPRRFDAALDEMLNGGRSMYLEGETAFGKVEQLVVLRARLGPGEYHRSVPSEVVTTEHEAARHETEHDQRGWNAQLKLGMAAYPGATGKPASLMMSNVFANLSRMTGSDRFREHRESVTTTREGPAVQFLHGLTVEMEVYPYARPGTYTRFLGARAPALAPRRFGRPWREEFALGPGAARSTVARDEAVPAGADPAPPLERVDGSLRQHQHEQRGRSGFSEQAQVRPRPVPASRLHEAVRALAFGDARGDSAWPGLRPRAAHQLFAATSAGQLGSHLRQAMSDSGHVVPLVGDRLEKVHISLDAHRRELLDVLDGGTTSRSSTRVEGGKPVSERGLEVGFANTADVRQMNVGEAPARPAQLVAGLNKTATKWASKHGTEISTARPERSGQQRRYVVRLQPRWRITPTWRGEKVPASWQRTRHIAEDDPIVLEVDRAGLEDLGLHVPEEQEPSGPGGRESGDRAAPQQDPSSAGGESGDPLQDWLLYERALLGEHGSADASSAGSGGSAPDPGAGAVSPQPPQARAGLSDFLLGRADGDVSAGRAPVEGPVDAPRQPGHAADGNASDGRDSERPAGPDGSAGPRRS